MTLAMDRPLVPAVPPRGRPWTRETAKDKGTLTVIYVCLALFGVVILFPLLYIVAASVSSGTAVIDNRVWVWPVGFTLLAYKEVFDYPGFWQSYLNSVIYTVAGTALSVSLSVMLGWPLSRTTFWGRRFLSFAVLFAFLFSGGIVPLYLVVEQLGMINTRWSQNPSERFEPLLSHLGPLVLPFHHPRGARRSSRA